MGFSVLARWLTELSRKGAVRADDVQATAAVLLSSLAFFRLMEAMFGERPGGLTDARFLEAWVQAAMGALAPGRPGAAQRSR